MARVDIDVSADSGLATDLLTDLLAEMAADAHRAADALAGKRLTATRSCPQCGGPAARVSRKLTDRMLSVVMPVKRYRCFDLNCNWEGLLMSRRRPVGSGA